MNHCFDPKSAKRSYLWGFLVFILLHPTSVMLAQSPGGAGTPTLWLRADQGAENGGVVADDGEGVDIWQDQGGNNDGISSTGASDPIFRERASSVFNFNPYLEFNGTSSRLAIQNLSYSSESNSQYYIWVVFKTDFNGSSDDGNKGLIDFGEDQFFSLYVKSNAADNQLRWAYRNSTFVASTIISDGFTNLNDNLPHIGAGIYDNILGDDTKLRVDGNEEVSSAEFFIGEQVGSNTTRFGYIGDGSSASTEDGGGTDTFFDGEIAEIIYYENVSLPVLNIDNVEAIESYLAIKYGITLPFNYLAGDLGTVYNRAEASSGFNNDIAGIGRDDLSDLDQVKSSSINPDAILVMALTENGGSFINPDDFTSNDSWMLWGNNNDDDGIIEEISSELPAEASFRLDREWRIQESGSVGNVDMEFDLSGISLTGNQTEQFKLMIDEDGNGNFSNGTITYITADDFSSSVLSFSGVDFSDGDIFTIGINLPPTLDLDADNSSGSAGSDYNEVFLHGRQGVAIADVDVNISDPDNTTMSGATITLTNSVNGSDESLSISGTLSGGIVVSQAYDHNVGILELSGTATIADYNAALQQVVYENTSVFPGTADRSIDVVVSDGNTESNLTSTTVAIKFAPVLTSLGPAATTDEETQVEITFSDIQSIADEFDQDGVVTSFLVKTVSSGSLLIGADAGSATVFASGTNDMIDAANNAYWTPANNESGTVSAFEIVARDNDGFESIPDQTLPIVVNEMNDPPTAVDDNSSANQGEVVTIANITFNDIDNDGTVDPSTIILIDPSNGANVGDKNDVLVIPGEGSYNIDNTGKLTFTPESAFTGTALVNYTLEDNDQEISNTASISISIGANTAPVVDLDADDGSGANGFDFTVGFTSGNVGAIIADADVSITDGTNSELASVTVVLSNRPDGINEQLIVDGTLPPGITIVDPYSDSDGKLVLSGKASLDDYESALKLIRYKNVAIDLDPVPRIVNALVSDGIESSNQPNATVESLTCNDYPQFVFNSVTQEVNVPGTVGDIYRFDNVISGTDALVEIIANNNAEIVNIDDTNLGFDNSFQPTIDQVSGSYSEVYIDFRITFVEAGTSTPISYSNIAIVSMDIDGNGAARDFIGFRDSPGVSLENVNNIDRDFDDPFVTFESSVTIGVVSTDLTETDHMVYGTYNNTATFDIRAGVKDPNGTGIDRVILFDMFNGCFFENFNDPETTPTSVSKKIAINEDENFNFSDVDFTFGDFNGDDFGAVVITRLPANGTLNYNSNPVTATDITNATEFTDRTLFEFVPGQDENGDPYADIVYEIKDNSAHDEAEFSASRDTIVFKVKAVNDTPESTDDFYTILEGGLFTANDPDGSGGDPTVFGLLANDLDADGETLTVSLLSGPTYNANEFNLNPDGTFTYVHDGSEVLSDVFTYRATDPNGTFSDGTANLTITPINDLSQLDPDSDNSSGATGDEYYTHFISGEGPVNITDTDTEILDDDNTTIESVTITLTNRPDGTDESLSVSATLPGTLSVTDPYDDSDGQLVISGTGSFNDYQTAIELIVYDNTSGTPDIAERKVNITLNDGGSDGDPALTRITVSSDSDYDNDGIADLNDLDDNNDGIPDTEEFCLNGGFACLPGGFDPSGDEDGDNVFNYKDADDPAFTNGCPSSGGICTSLIAAYDTDGDGIPNHRDRNTDGDSCADAIEAGHNQNLLPGGMIAGPYGSNGLSDRVETTVDSGILNYTLTETQTGTYDAQNFSIDSCSPQLDLDSDDSSTATGSDYIASFTEGQVNQPIADLDAIILDGNNVNLVSLTITLTNDLDGTAEGLSVEGSLPPGIAISDSYNSVDGKLAFSGSANLSSYRTVLRQLVYNNSSKDPDTTPRSITFTVNDGDSESNTATTTLSIIPVNNDPISVNDTNNIAEGTTSVNEADGSGSLVGNDIDDDGDLTSVSQLNSESDPANDVNGVYGTIDWATDGTYIYSLDNASVDYLKQGETVVEVFNYAVFDGLGTDNGTLNITIAGTNDDPVGNGDTNLIASGEVSVDESNGSGGMLDNDVDVDGDLLSVASIEGINDPGTDITGTYGTLDWATDGTYVYTVDNANPTVQNLGLGQSVFDIFNYVVTDASANDIGTLTLTIVGERAELTIAANDDTGAEPGTDEGQYTVTLSTLNSTGAGIPVDYSVSGSAVEGSDFTTLSGTVTIPDNETNATIDLEVLDDTDLEASESVTLTLSETGLPPGITIGSPSNTTVTILDDESASADIGTTSVGVEDSGGTPTNATIDINLSKINNTGSDVTVNYSFTGGTATGGVDYDNSTTSVNIPDGSNSATIVIPIIEDNDLEGTESIEVTLTGVISTGDVSVGSPPTISINILDDETATVSIGTPGDGLEGSPVTNSTFDITLSKINLTGGDITVNFTYSGSATGGAGNDYDNDVTGIAIPDGSDNISLIVPVLDDGLLESSETIEITLTGVGLPANVSLGTFTSTANIIDDEIASATISASDGSAAEPGTDDGEFTVSLDLENNTGNDIIINYTVDGTATATDDYGVLSGSITISDGQSSATLVVDVLDDAVLEPSETVIVTLDNAGLPGNVVLGGLNSNTVNILDNDEASVTVNNVSGSEGNNLLFTVSLDNDVQGSFSVDVSFSDNSAEGGGVDYTSTGQLLNFNGISGETEQFTVATVNDNIREIDETFNISLVASNTLVTDTDTGLGTIVDNDVSSLSINDVTVNESDGSAIFTVTLNGAVQGGSSVSYTINDGSASGSSDFDNTAGVLIFSGNDGEQKTISVSITEDAVTEGSETFTVSLISSNSLVIDTSTGTGTIVDNDTSTLLISDVSVDENSGNATFSVTLQGAVQGGLNLAYTFTDLSAAGGSDYDNTGGNLSFIGTDNEQKSIVVAIADDAVTENSESFRVDISSSNPLVDDSDSAIGTITDNDSSVITLADITTSESDEQATFTLTLTGALQGGTVVTYSTTDGTATGGSDFDNTGGTVSFIGTDGEQQTFDISITNDAVLETSESFTVNISSSNTVVDDSDNSAATITDNDNATISLENESAIEGGDLTFTVTLDNAVQGAFTVSISYADNSATGGDDYDNTLQVLNFAGTAGESQQFTVSTVNDAELEGTETFTVSLDASNSLVDDSDEALATINDDDSTAITIEDITAEEGNDLQFTVTLNNVVASPFTVDVSLTDNSATGGSDFDNSPVVLNFVGTTGETQQFTITTTDDVVLEGAENFVVSLLSSNSLIDDDDIATGTITDNDAASVTIENITGGEGTGLTFTVTLDNDVQGTFDVGVTFSGGTATGGLAPLDGNEDYVNDAINLSFAGNASEMQMFVIETQDDNVLEGEETFTVGLVSVNTLVDDEDTAVGTITDNDAAAITVQNANATEGSGILFSITLDNPVQGAFNVEAILSNGTANGGTDFSNATQMLSFSGNAGEVRQFTVNTQSDNILEGDETFNVSLSASNNLLDDSDTGIGTIDDDDSASLSISDAGNSEGNNIVFTVGLDNPVQGSFDVDIGFTNGSAIGSSDFDNSTQTLNFAGIAGESHQFSVLTTDDNILEGDEDFTITLTSTNILVNDAATALADITDNDAAAITIANASATEGNSILFTATLDNPVSSNFTVNVTFTDDTAEGGVDFDNTAQILNFVGNAGETELFAVPTTDDMSLEGTETFTVSISSSNALVDVSDIATGTINDDDVTAVTVEDISATEGSGLLFTVTLNNAVASPFSVDVSLSDLDATGVEDYDNTLQTLNFAGTPGETQQFTVTTVDDNILEGVEEFTVGLTASNSLIDDNDIATGTITDNDTATLTIDDETEVEGNSLVFRVTLDTEVSGAFTVNTSFTDINATGSADYSNSVQILNFMGTAGETKQLTISSIDDSILEQDETFIVIISSSNGLIDDSDNAAGTITDNDTASITISDASATEGEGIAFVVSLDNQVYAPFTVDINFVDGSANGGVDFDQSTQVLSFNGTAGESKQFIVPTIEDTDAEGTQDFTAILSASNNLISDTSTATGSILDDDEAVLTIDDRSTTEGGDLQFTVVLNNATPGPFTVDVNFIDNSATGALDFDNVGKILNFLGLAGESKQFTIITIDDEILEDIEIFTLQLSSSDLSVDDSDIGIGTITDNDSATLTIADATAAEGEDLVFTVTLNIDVSAPFTVNVLFSDVSSTGSSDYDNSAPTLNFSGIAGESQQFTVPVIDDDVVENSETFLVNISSSDAKITDTDLAIATITENDVAVLTVNDFSGTEGDQLSIEISLDKAVFEAFNVTVTFANGTALSDSDFEGLSQVVNFTGSAGETQSITINSIDDTLIEGDETFIVSISTSNVLVDDTDTATGTITDNDFNSNPVAMDDEVEITEGGVAMIKVLDNDNDSDGDQIRINSAGTNASGGSDGRSENGGVVIINNNSTPDNPSDDFIEYTPPDDFEGVDSFEYTLSDGRGGLVTAKVIVTVIPENNAPIADQLFLTVTVTEGPLTGNLLDNVSDPDGDDLILSVNPIFPPLHGTLTLNSDGSFEYTADPGYEGPDSFIYEVCDSGVPSLCIEVTVELDIIDDTPVEISKGFSPDGDGVNDFWVIDGIEDFPNNKVTIFNRWGNAVFEVNGYDNSSNVWASESNIGVILGRNQVPDGTYFYVIDLGDGSSPVSGFIVINR